MILQGELKMMDLVHLEFFASHHIKIVLMCLHVAETVAKGLSAIPGAPGDHGFLGPQWNSLNFAQGYARRLVKKKERESHQFGTIPAGRIQATCVNPADEDKDTGNSEVLLAVTLILGPLSEALDLCKPLGPETQSCFELLLPTLTPTLTHPSPHPPRVSQRDCEPFSFL